MCILTKSIFAYIVFGIYISSIQTFEIICIKNVAWMCSENKNNLKRQRTTHKKTNQIGRRKNKLLITNKPKKTILLLMYYITITLFPEILYVAFYFVYLFIYS